jgi:AcrR family transcriptional regulator
VSEAEVDESRERGRPPRRRQQEILDAAARVFHEKGYDSTSIQDIAGEVGILKGSLYYYISSKEDLLFEIIERTHREGLENVNRALESEGDALEKLRTVIVAHLTFLAENLVRVGVFLHEFRALGEERRRRIVGERDAFESIVRDLIRQGQSEGVVRDEIDPKLASLAILGMMNWLYQWYRPDGESSVAEVAEAFADFAVAGLASDPAARAA